MAGPRQSSPVFQRSRFCAVGLLGCAVVVSGPAPAQVSSQGTWQAAVAARQSFEAEPREEHTRDEFAQVMDNFRLIYHGDPADFHSPRAVNEVAELLAEQGRELNDPKSLRAAAGQYEFLAKAYPASSLAAPALGHALNLLRPDTTNDAAEASMIRKLLQEQYPRSAAAQAALLQTPAVDAATLPARRKVTPAIVADASANASPGNTAASALDEPHYVKPSARSHAAAGAQPVAASALDPVDTAVRADAGRAPAVVTGIRHWSTATYTRVAIDLGGEVEFKAARVEHPDRIFFDLHGAKLAAGLAGKSFAITDEGFLKNIRAAQSGPEVTRIMLDVQPVAEYSAFLLPNPYRLIIDIHGRQPGETKIVAAADSTPTRRSTPAEEPPSPAATEMTEQPPAPISRPSAAPYPSGGTEVSSLPPMAVTDGSAGFGLPPKRDTPVTKAAVARPRVVVSARPTEAKPVPNSVTSNVPVANREVAEVSEGPGVIAATARPTTGPVVDRAAKMAVRPGKTAPSRSMDSAAIPAAPPPPTANGQSTLMRALGLKIGRIVIDAGHGGHDSGTLGPDGIEEKDVVLDVSLRLGKLLHDRLGAEVVYTRADDTFIPLETRTAIANKAQADLFISVHANSSPDPSARGVEVYYLNFTSDPEAMQVAGRENAVSSQRVNQLSDLVKQIALKDKIDESRELAADVDQSLFTGLKKGNGGLKDRGVKKAPFVVLIGANMPSILAEISFVTNPDDASKLDMPEYRERVAESLYTGIARYAGAINGAGGSRAKSRPTERAQR